MTYFKDIFSFLLRAFSDLFSRDSVLVNSASINLQLTPEQFSIMEKGGLPSEDGEELLPQVKEFKYLRVHT